MNKYILSILGLLTCALASASKDFELPSVPDSLRSPAERAGYVIEHFWDNISFENPLISENEDKFEQAFANFSTIISLAPEKSQKEGIKNLFVKVSENQESFEVVSSLVEKYLYNFDSPYKDEDLYALFLNEVVGSKKIDNSSKIRPRMQLADLQKNRKGDKASDFEFIDRHGVERSLYQSVGGKHAILMFYDPDCDHCRQLIQELKESDDIKRLEDLHQISIIAVYSGEDKELWEQTNSTLPGQWTVGFDGGVVEDEEIYVIRSMPTVYILDGDGIILEKEVLQDKVVDVLKNMF